MSEARKAQPMPPDLQPITLPDSRTGWKCVGNKKEINEACNRWLEKNDPFYFKCRRKRFGQL